MSQAPKIGVFDSGVGGLTVLRALRAQLPQANLIYVADSAHAPYGDRPDDFLQQRARQITRFLIGQGARLIVVACNTATAAAIAALRAEFDLPFVGIEPGIKPALARSDARRVGVLATPSTLRSDKFRALLHTHAAAAEPVLQPCPGLADAVERGDLQAPQVQQLIHQFCAPLRTAGCDTVVLGCTHYPLLAEQIQAALGPQVHLLDTAEPVARQAARLWQQTTSQAPELPQIMRKRRAAPSFLTPLGGPGANAAGLGALYTNGDLAVVRRMADLCGLQDAAIHHWVEVTA